MQKDSIFKTMDRLPDWVVERFQAIDNKDSDSTQKCLTADFGLQFAQYDLQGIRTAVKYVSNFDNWVPTYQHEANETWINDEILQLLNE